MPGADDPSGAPTALASLTTEALARFLDGPTPVVLLVPVGSTEPHGPHLPLGTDAIISEGVCRRAAERLRGRGVLAFVAPALAYGVTDFAAGFAGAVSVPAAALSAFLRAIVESLIEGGAAHVSLVNNHLEPAHDAAVRAAVEGLAPRASVASPLTRRWGRTLTDEYKSGACHAGRYETSLVRALTPALVDLATAASLPDLDHLSLSEGIKNKVDRFEALGMTRAYAGSPRSASDEEGFSSLERLADMVVAEVEEGLAAAGARPT